MKYSLLILVSFVVLTQGQHDVSFLPPLDPDAPLPEYITKDFDFLDGFDPDNYTMPGARTVHENSIQDKLAPVRHELHLLSAPVDLAPMPLEGPTPEWTVATIGDMMTRLDHMNRVNNHIVSLLGNGDSHNDCPNDYNSWHNHAQCDDYPKYMCPPDSDTCNRMNHAFRYNYCVQRTVDYRDAASLQAAGTVDKQRDQTPARGRPATTASIRTGFTFEPVGTLGAFGNVGPNNYPSYMATATKARVATQHVFLWVTMDDARTNATGGPSSGGSGWWKGEGKVRYINDLLLPFCKNITKTWATADPVVNRIHEVNTPGCPICWTMDYQCRSMSEDSGYLYDFGTIDISTVSPSFIQGERHIWGFKSKINGATDLMANWAKTGYVVLETSTDPTPGSIWNRGDYRYWDCPRHDSLLPPHLQFLNGGLKVRP